MDWLCVLTYSQHLLIWLSDWDLVFPDDEKERNPGTMKLLQLAHAWKAKQQEQQAINNPPQADVASSPPKIEVVHPLEDVAQENTASTVS